MTALFQLVLTAYILSLGFGMLLKGGKGLKAVNSFWVKLISRSIALLLRSFGALLQRAARAIR